VKAFPGRADAAPWTTGLGATAQAGADYGAKLIFRELGDWTFAALSVARSLIV
jgi:hypothetical protein